MNQPYLERAVVVPGTPPLEGLYHRGRRPQGALVLSVGPDAGSMDIPAVAEIAFAVTRAGFPTLRCNYPGVGASPGPFSVEAAEEAAARAAEHLEATTGTGAGLVFAGVGLGACLAARLCAERGGARAVLVQPQTSLLSSGPPAAAVGEVLVVAAGADPEEDVEAWRRFTASSPSARLLVVREADRVWRSGLVRLGAAAAEHLGASSPD